MWSQWIVPRVIAQPAMSSPAAEHRAGGLARLASRYRSVLETRVEQRWQRAKDDPQRRLVHVDGWSTEQWLARRAAARGHQPSTMTSDASGAVDPHLSASDLLALRTRLITGTGGV
jgi:hypothetical protein